MIYVTPSSDRARHYDIIIYNYADKSINKTIYVTQAEFDRLLQNRDYDTLDLNSRGRMHMVKDYIKQYPDCIHSNHPLRFVEEVA